MQQLVLADGEVLFGVVEKMLRGVRRGLVEADAFGGGRDFAIVGQGFAINDHELAPVVGRGKVEHANLHRFLRKGEVVPGEEAADGGAVGARVIPSVVVQKTLMS